MTAGQRAFWLALLGAALVMLGRHANGALPSMIDFGQIAARADGLHAMPFSKNGHACLWFWTTNADNGWEQVLTNQFFHWPKAEFMGDKIALVDMGGDYAAGRASTWTLDGQKLDEQVFGNQWMRWGSSCLMPSGGAVFVNYSQETASIVLDINYRRPPAPPAPAPTALPASPWWTNRLILPPCQGEIPSANVQVAELNGIIHVFITRDSAGCLMLLRLKDDGAGGLTVLDWQPSYISDDTINGVTDFMKPHGEFPDLVVRKDPWHNRIIAMYQASYASKWCESPYCRPMIIGINPDLTREIVMAPFPPVVHPQASTADPHPELELWPSNYCERTIYLTCWARPDGPYYIQENSPNCGDWGWISGGPHGGYIRPVEVHYYLSASPDGWWASWGTNNDVHIQKMKFAPYLNIAKANTLTRSQVMALAAQAAATPDAQSFPAPENVSVSGWDGPATVEATVNLKQWGIYGTNLTAPVLVPETKPQQFFRVRSE